MLAKKHSSAAAEENLAFLCLIFLLGASGAME